MSKTVQKGQQGFQLVWAASFQGGRAGKWGRASWLDPWRQSACRGFGVWFLFVCLFGALKYLFIIKNVRYKMILFENSFSKRDFIQV